MKMFGNLNQAPRPQGWRGGHCVTSVTPHTASIRDPTDGKHQKTPGVTLKAGMQAGQQLLYSHQVLQGFQPSTSHKTLTRKQLNKL